MTLTTYIPTYRRVGKQETWSWLPDAVRENTYLVAPEDEADTLDMLGYNVLACPVQGIGNTRQWIIDQHDRARGNVVLMMDDDLKFSARRMDEPTKFHKPAKGSAPIQDMFNQLNHMMLHVPFGGLAARSGANRVVEPYRLNSRIYDTWAINVDVAADLGIRVNRLPFMEDFDTALQFLTKGYASLSLNTYVKDDSGSNATGGCSEYRDDAGQDLAAMQLAAMWPDYVTLTERPGWNGMDGTRTDVRVAWQKAHKAGREARDMLGQPQEPELDWSTGKLVAL